MSEQQVPSRLVFRVPSVAILAALLAMVCATPAAFAAPGLVALYAVPLAVIVWVLRVRTVADTSGLRVRHLFGGRSLAWDDLKGFRLTERGKVRAVPSEGEEVALPSVRVRHLSALSLVSGGRLDDPAAGMTTVHDDEDEDAGAQPGTGGSERPAEAVRRDTVNTEPEAE